MYQYLIQIEGETPFLTHWHSPELHPEKECIVYDLLNRLYSADGVDWFTIEEDNL